jgi:CheY-like chemotaxis protein
LATITAASALACAALPNVVTVTAMQPRTVLVADDDRLMRESLCDCLAQLGHCSCTARDGGEAIQVLGRTRCDLLVSDIEMPDMTGFQLISWVMQHHPIPTVLMSARSDSALPAAAREAGAIQFLRKPVGITSLASLFLSLFPQPPSDGR